MQPLRGPSRPKDVHRAPAPKQTGSAGIRERGDDGPLTVSETSLQVIEPHRSADTNASSHAGQSGPM